MGPKQCNFMLIFLKPPYSEVVNSSFYCKDDTRLLYTACQYHRCHTNFHTVLNYKTCALFTDAYKSYSWESSKICEKINV